MLDSISKGGHYECFIITANVLWEALEMTGPEHPNGFMTGITKGVNLESAAGNATSLSGKF